VFLQSPSSSQVDQDIGPSLFDVTATSYIIEELVYTPNENFCDYFTIASLPLAAPPVYSPEYVEGRFSEVGAGMSGRKDTSTRNLRTYTMSASYPRS
jgi:hypothetical protein